MFLVYRQSCPLTRNIIKHMKYQHFLCSQNPSSWNTHKNQWNINTFCVPDFLVYKQPCLLTRKHIKTNKISPFPLLPESVFMKILKFLRNINTFCVLLCLMFFTLSKNPFKTNEITILCWKCCWGQRNNNIFYATGNFSSETLLESMK